MNALCTSPKSGSMVQLAGTRGGSGCRVGLPIGLLVSVFFGFGLTACTDKSTPPQLPKVPPLSTPVPTTQVLGVQANDHSVTQPNSPQSPASR